MKMIAIIAALALACEIAASSLGGQTVPSGIAPMGRIGMVTRLLPDGYTQVEYLQSSGTQYIDTGVANTSSTDWSVDFLLPTYASHRYVFGMIDEVVLKGSYNGLISGGSSVVNTYRAGYNATLTDNLAGILTNRCTISRIGNLLKYNGTTTTTFTSGTWSSEYTLALFAVRTRESNIFVKSEARKFGVKIWVSSVLVRDYVPARRGTDNVLGMYDLVNGTFETNDGTGSFSAGPDVAQ